MIRGEKTVGLSFVFIIIRSLVVGLLIGVFLDFFCQRIMTFQVSRINFPNIKGWLKVRLSFCITYLLYYFFPHIQILSQMVQPGLNKRTQSFSEIAYQGCFFWGTGRVKFLQYSLQVFQVYDLVYDFLQLILRVLSNFYLIIINKGLRISQHFMEEYLKLT